MGHLEHAAVRYGTLACCSSIVAICGTLVAAATPTPVAILFAVLMAAVSVVLAIAAVAGWLGWSTHWRQSISSRTRSFVWVGIALVLCGVAIRWSFFPGVPFDADEWRAAERAGADRSNGRLGMGARLVRTGALIGKTKTEVLVMLGEPMPHPEFADWDLVYWLGPERSFMVLGSEYLLLRLSEESRVRECRIMSDG